MIRLRPVLLVLFALGLILAAGIWITRTAPDVPSFRFAVFGDSRTMAHLPFDQNQANATARYSKPLMGSIEEDRVFYGYDPDSGLLDTVYGLSANGKTQRILSYSQGWPRMMWETETGSPPRLSYDSSARRRLLDQVVGALEAGAENEYRGPLFCLHTGDMIWGDSSPASLGGNPYWAEFDEHFLSRLPSGGPDDLPARFFPALGNHELWTDPAAAGTLAAMPYLAKYGFGENDHCYSFDFRGSRFIFLDTGGYDGASKADWGDTRPGQERQMARMTAWLDDARRQGVDHVFVVFHKPAFTLAGHGPLPEEHNPHRLLASFADHLDITVFNGHVHTTEAFEADGVRYLVLGGGGADQEYAPRNPPTGYPDELYWNGEARQPDFNWVEVRVHGDEVRFLVHSFRPEAPEAERTREIELFAAP